MSLREYVGLSYDEIAARLLDLRELKRKAQAKWDRRIDEAARMMAEANRAKKQRRQERIERYFMQAAEATLAPEMFRALLDAARAQAATDTQEET